MRHFKKGLALLMTLLIVLSLGTAVSAAEAAAGETVTLSFEFTNIDSLDGVFTYSNPDMIASKTYECKIDGMIPDFGKDTAFMSSSAYGDLSGSVDVILTLSAEAKAGDTCTVTFDYNYSNDGGNSMQTGSKSMIVTVKETGTDVDPNPTPDPKPTPDPEPNIDYEELKKQIDIAGQLNQPDYTKETWAALKQALDNANACLTSKDQKEVDKAAADLAAAIAGLKKMDYSALQAAVDAAIALRDGDELGQLWADLAAELAKAAELMTSGDQEAVNACAARILELITKIQEALKDLVKVEEVIKEVEVEVEVLPKGDYCNISMHQVWPILFFISLALNLVLGGLLVFFFVKKKKNTDDTPLVDYDPSDDD